ncbi:MAG: hypothetical protein OXU68_13470 [Bacteroidota bacterium]|nr:hypothetical protein [Bacteroidota bacterium]
MRADVNRTGSYEFAGSLPLSACLTDPCTIGINDVNLLGWIFQDIDAPVRTNIKGPDVANRIVFGPVPVPIWSLSVTC